MRALWFGLLGLAPILAQAETLPPPIAARMAYDKENCGQPVRFEPGFITRKDVNGDGVPDFILDYGHFVCGDSHSFYCGSGGCTTAIYASSNGHFVKALDDLAQGLSFGTVEGRPAVQLGLHGSACGKVGVAPCGVTLYWNGRTFSPAR